MTSGRHAMIQLWRQNHITARIESWSADGLRRGIRYAYPLLDRRVVEFIFSLPEESFSDGDWGRLFFRQAISPILPKQIVWKRLDTEFARIGAMQEAVLPAFREMGKHLEEHPPTRRADYLDLPRLVEDLTSESLESRSGFGKLFLALNFLGEEATGP